MHCVEMICSLCVDFNVNLKYKYDTQKHTFNILRTIYKNTLSDVEVQDDQSKSTTHSHVIVLSPSFSLCN